MYSARLVDWAKNRAQLSNRIELAFVQLCLESRFAQPDALTMVLEEELDRECIAELAKCYGLIFREDFTRKAERVTVCVYATPREPPGCSIPKISLSRSSLLESSSFSHSEKYSRSALLLNRAPPSIEPRFAIETPGASCSVLAGSRRGHSGMFALLYTDDDERAPAPVKPEDSCCVCLEPFLVASRAVNGETLSFLSACSHVLHTECARKLMVSQKSSGAILCPICRSKSTTSDVPLLLETSGPAGNPVKGTTRRTRSGPRGQQFEHESQASILVELASMGFDGPLAAEVLERCNGDKASAIDILLSWS